MTVFTTSVSDTYLEPLRSATPPDIPDCFSERVYRQYLNGTNKAHTVAQQTGRDEGRAAVFLQDDLPHKDDEWVTFRFNNGALTLPPVASEVDVVAVPAQDLNEIPQPWKVRGAVLGPTGGPDYMLTPFFSGCAFGIFEYKNTVCVVHVRPVPGAPGTKVGTSETLAALLAGQCPPKSSDPYLTVTEGASSTVVDSSNLRVVLGRTGSARTKLIMHRGFKQFNYDLGSIIGARGADQKWRFYAQEMTGTKDKPLPPRKVRCLYPT